MSESSGHSHSQEPHPWAHLSTSEVLSTVVYELYGPVSALGAEVDRLANDTFQDDDDLNTVIEQMRTATNQLSRLVVTLKRYTAERAE